MAILDFLIVCVRSQPALLGYMCDIKTSPTATFGAASILPAVVELLGWSTQVISCDRETPMIINPHLSEHQRCCRCHWTFHPHCDFRHSILGRTNATISRLFRENVPIETLESNFVSFRLSSCFRNNFWKNASTPISTTTIRIEMMDTGDKRAVAASFRLLTQHLLNYTT